MTQLAAGKVIAKTATAKRIEVIGSIDELNAYLGLAREIMHNILVLNFLSQSLIRIQHELFNLGAQLAVLATDKRTATPFIQSANVTTLEHEIDQINAQLPSLSSFILPGGGQIAAHLHVACNHLPTR